MKNDVLDAYYMYLIPGPSHQHQTNRFLIRWNARFSNTTMSTESGTTYENSTVLHFIREQERDSRQLFAFGKAHSNSQVQKRCGGMDRKGKSSTNDGHGNELMIL